MKKLMTFSFLILMIYISGIAFVNYGYSAMQTIEGNKTQISIGLPHGETEATFLSKIKQKMDELDSDIMIRYIDNLNGKLHHKYYMINNTNRFIQILGSKDHLAVKDNDCFSTAVQSSCNYQPLRVPNTLQEISLYSWSRASFVNNDKITAFIEEGRVQDVSEEIVKLGYAVSIASGRFVFMQFDPKLFLFIPSFMFIISIMFYVLSNGKKNVLRKYEGYTAVQVTLDELEDNFPSMFLITTVVLIISLIVGFLSFQGSFIQFLLFYLRSLMVIVVISIVGILIAGFLIGTQSSAEYIKGKAPKKGIYYTTIFGKIVFLVFFLFSLSLGINVIRLVIDNTNTAREIQERVAHYVTVPIYENNASARELDDNYLEFYKLTVEKLNGILIDAGYYRQDEWTGRTQSEEDDLPFITINDNYLNINPILTNTGKPISSSMFDKEKQNVLIPLTKLDDKKKYEEIISTWFSKPLVFIEYDGKASQIYSFNPGVGSDSLGRIDQPIIIIFDIDSENAGGFIKSYVSQRSYLLKVSTQNPYEELLPYIDQAGIGSVSPRTPYVMEGFQEFVSFQENSLYLYLSQSALFLIGILSLIIFSTHIFFENNNRQIACSLIEGSTLADVMRQHLFFSLISFVLIVGLLFGATQITTVTVNHNLLLAVLTAELIVTFIIGKNYAARNVALIMKGEQ